MVIEVDFDEDRVVAIIPATGWSAVHQEDDGVTETPVVAWGLQGTGHLVAMTPDISGYVHPAPEDKNFRGIFLSEGVFSDEELSDA